ncbi:MAG: DUF2339 domain-containing protein [Phycisphaerae bacterium]|nr:DUF2339 domain-containing protein [Phycisphaerae bacterium]
MPATVTAQPKPAPAAETKPAAGLLEERIGTRWVLIAGVIAVLFAAGFFLKYAYENFSVSDIGKVLAVAVFGLASLAAGEITRRRGYDIVAKGVTAMGFGLLYVAVFAAYRVFDLMPATPAFAVAIGITACAMAYAVVLDEVIIAFLSLLGGYLTPLLLSTGHNLPNPLFTYVLVLSVGAMLCAYMRRWRTVNILAYLGTYALYAGWYEKFFRQTLHAGAELPEQTPIALTWLAVFFAIYLIMPILNGLVHKVKAAKGDVLCVLGNAVIVFFYLWSTLGADARLALAWCAVAMAAAHLLMMAVVCMRCRTDADLRMVLLALGLSFLTIAMPLYWRLNALAMAWALQGVLLLLIGLRYRSILTQAFGTVALLLACGNLLLRVPMHNADFALIRNAAFGTWLFVAVAACAAHLLYRFAAKSHDDPWGLTSQILYGLMGALLLAAMSMEWYAHCKYNLPGFSMANVVKGQLVILNAMVLLFVVRPICPAGILRQSLAVFLIAAGTLCMLALLPLLHTHDFRLLANRDLAVTLGFIAVVALCHVIHRRASQTPDDPNGIASQLFYALVAALLFLALSAEWYFHCRYNMPGAARNILADPCFLRGVVILSGFTLLFFAARPLCPPGAICIVCATLTAACGAVITMAAFESMHNDAFTIFANADFAAAVLFIAALGIAAWLLKDCKIDGASLGGWFALGAVVVLWVIVSAEVWLFWQRSGSRGPADNWRFLAHMYLSVTWALYGAALMVAGFVFRKRSLRYMALALFALLLGKVFIIDTQKVQQVYRIAAFFATGITLVGVSYLYQFLKKKGFFDQTPTKRHEIQ